MSKKDPKAEIEIEILDQLETEKGLQALEQELSQNDKFRQFLELQKTVKEESDKLWKRVGDEMVRLYEAGAIPKSLKYDWGTLTVAERTDFDIDTDKLAPRFCKTIPDTTKIRAIYQLTGEPPKGSTPKTVHYMRKVLKV